MDSQPDIAITREPERSGPWWDRLYTHVSANREAFTVAFIWVMLLCFFTYTPLIVELLKAEGDFPTEFYSSQSQWIALAVNIGIILMLLFDNHVQKKRLDGLYYYTPLIAIVLCIAIKAHCDAKIENSIKDYIAPIAYESFSIWVFFVFIIATTFLKANSLIPQSKKPGKSVKDKNSGQPA